MCIEGISPEASKHTVNDLLEPMIRPDIVYHHVWPEGDLLVIDNRPTVHRAR